MTTTEVGIPGGCEQCDALTRFPVVYYDGHLRFALTVGETGQVCEVTIEHAEWCPALAEIERRIR